MTRTEVEDTVRRFYAARVNNDADACMAALTPDSGIQIVGCAKSSPIPIKSAGAEELRGLVDQMVAMWQFSSNEFLNIVIDGNQAAVRCKVGVTFAPTGETFETEVFDLFEVEDGKVSYITEFLDTALVARLAESVAAG